MNEIYYCYALLDPRKCNQPFYIGKGKDNRWKEHLRETKEETKNIFKWNTINAIRAAGLEVGIEIISDNLDENTAYELETKLIKYYGRKGYEKDGILTNKCIDNRPPSSHGRVLSEETKLKMSNIAKGRRKSAEHRAALSAATKGKPKPQLVPNKKWTEYEDNYIFNNTLEESIENLKRSKKSIEMRKWRIINNLLTSSSKNIL